jgi:predicted class III extradiol MEMO1 family dioxygenase
MLKMLKHTYRETTEFVPFQMKSKHPEAYARILSQQSKMIADQHVIVMQYITSDTMYYLTDRIAAVDGVIDLLEVPNSEEIGKYRVLVHIDDFHKARKSLQSDLPTWYDECVPDDAKPNQDRFPGNPEVVPIMSDGYSSGEDSYYSSSVNTALSYDSVSSDITN